MCIFVFQFNQDFTGELYTKYNLSPQRRLLVSIFKVNININQNKQQTNQTTNKSKKKYINKLYLWVPRCSLGLPQETK
ncbi:hypothetical protein EFL79_10675 [Weissella confusa]|nr:hypothetical protein [Weissella confusa]